MTTQTYELFVRTDPATLWQALTEGAKTEQYFFGTYLQSALTPGSAIEYRRGPGGPKVVEGQVLEVDPTRRLVHTWAVRYDAALAEETSKVTWLLEPRGENVKLTVVHDLSQAPSTAKHVATDGWSVVLSSLKSMLETGTPLRMPGQG